MNDKEFLDEKFKGEYLGFNPPGIVAEVFAPDLISGKGRLHSFPSFSSDKKEIYWMIIPPKIMTMKEVNGMWTSPKPALFSTSGRNQAPFVAHDDSIFFSSSREGGHGLLDIWHTTKVNNNYSIPINIGDKINTDQAESDPTVSENNTIFYTGSIQGKLYNKGIYYSIYENGEYKEPVFLPEQINIMNPNNLDYTPFIAPDESYLLFCSNRQNPEKELCHIYVSFKNKNGEWKTPIDLSKKMNYFESSKYPYVSPDNKFLFFSSGENFFWVDAKILDIERELK